MSWGSRGGLASLEDVVEMEIQMIEPSCRKHLRKRTGPSPNYCTQLENLIEAIEKNINPDVKATDAPVAPKLDPFLESQIIAYEELRKGEHVTHLRAISVIYHLNALINEVKMHSLPSSFLDGAILTEVFDSEGQSVKYWSVKGPWVDHVKYEHGKPTSDVSFLKGFLEHFFAYGDGIPNFDLEETIKAIGMPPHVRAKFDESMELIPLLMFQ